MDYNNWLYRLYNEFGMGLTFSNEPGNAIKLKDATLEELYLFRTRFSSASEKEKEVMLLIIEDFKIYKRKEKLKKIKERLCLK